MLFRPEAFEPLTRAAWDEERARRAIQAIVADAEGVYDAVALWPAEEWDAWGSPTPLTGLYVGTAGVVWALDALRRRGYAEVSIDLAAAANRAVERRREAPELSQGELELPAASDASLLNGETGNLAIAWRVGAGDGIEPEIERWILESRRSDSNEVMWGAPGALLAARAMLDWTGEDRWAQVWRSVADAVWDARDDDGVWTQRLHGRVSRGLGPVHGLVGNVRALLGGGELLSADRRERLIRDTTTVLERNVVREGVYANWNLYDGGPLAGGDGDPRLQWCHGAPGIVISTADFLPEELLVAGGELVWRAGPHGPDKGPGICHGTAGNGYAFLKLFERTGDEAWLDRARRFAMHALEQTERRVAGRYALFTGELGVALYLADCIDAASGYPLIETWD